MITRSGATRGFGTRGDDRGLDEIVADRVPKPAESPHTFIGDGAGEFRFERDHTPIGALDDQIDFALAAAGSKMKHLPLTGLGEYP